MNINASAQNKLTNLQSSVSFAGSGAIRLSQFSRALYNQSTK
jgi:hypothetical protein